MNKGARKFSINKVTDNIPDDQELVLPDGLIMTYFGDDFIREFSTQPEPAAEVKS